MANKKPSEMTVEELEAALAGARERAAAEAEAARLKTVPEIVDRLATLAELRLKVAETEAQMKPILATLAGAGGKPDDVRAALALRLKVATDEPALAPLMVAAISAAPDGWGRKPKGTGDGKSKPRPWHYVASFVDSKSGDRNVASDGGAVYSKARQAAEELGLPQQGGREDIPDELKKRILAWIEASPKKA